MSEINIFLLDISNNIKEDINIIKPKTFQEILEQIRKKANNFPELFEIFILDKENNDIKIDNEEKYKMVEDILFIREIDKNNLEKSLFELNYNKLSESKQDLLNEEYSCICCTVIIKNENPYLCYKCQRLIHEKCLKEWNEKCKIQNKNLSCPNCRNELPIENWNKKLNFEDNRKDKADMLNKIREYRLNKNMNKNINKIKDNIINELKNNNVDQNQIIKKYENYINKTIEIFKNILDKMNSIHSLMKLENNNKLNDLINAYPFNLENLNLDELSIIINEEFHQYENFIIIKL